MKRAIYRTFDMQIQCDSRVKLDLKPKSYTMQQLVASYKGSQHEPTISGWLFSFPQVGDTLDPEGTDLSVKRIS